RQYAEWALDVPMYFLVRDGRYIPGQGLTFREFMEQGFDGHQAYVSDWDTHLTTLFPEVRLKRILEVRGADAVPRALTCALPALWKGLLYDAEACASAWDLVSSFTMVERQQAQHSVARRGLAGEVAGLAVHALAGQLVEISSRGLVRVAERQGLLQDERAFLDPLQQVLEDGRSPGEVILENWRNDWNGSLERLIDFARY
ncbi:MAG: glutamate-cysteine ligase family protein, partial [Myxococcota bacterium]